MLTLIESLGVWDWFIAGGLLLILEVLAPGVNMYMATQSYDPLGELFVPGLRLALERHLHVIAHLHRGHRRVIGFATVVMKQPLPHRKLLRHHGGKRAEQTQKKNHLETFRHKTSNAPVLGMIVIFKDNLYSNNGFAAKFVPWVPRRRSWRPLVGSSVNGA